MKSEEHIFALLGLIIILLAALLLYFIYKEVKGYNGRCASPIARNAAFMRGAPDACSSGLEERDPWDRTQHNRRFSCKSESPTQKVIDST